MWSRVRPFWTAKMAWDVAGEADLKRQTAWDVAGEVNLDLQNGLGRRG